MNNIKAPDIVDRNLFTGLVEVTAYKETLELALKLHPQTRKAIIIIDNTPSGKYSWELIKKLIDDPDFKNIEFSRIDDSLYFSEIEEKLSILSDDTIVLFGKYFRDKSGAYFPLGEAVSRFSKASSRPMYGFHVEYLPYGLVGGKLLGGVSHGRKAAELVLRILNGEKVKDIPVITTTTAQYMFNFDELVRFGISPSDLPKDRIMINEPYSFYEENKSLVWATICIMIALVAIIFVLQTNIIKRKRSEEALRESEVRYRHIVETAYEGIWVIDAENKTIFANKRMAEMLGYTVDEMMGKSLFSFMDKEWKAVAHANVERRREGFTEQHDFMFRRKDSAEFWAIVTTNPFFDKDGRYAGALGMITDITERKRAEEELKKHRDHLEELVEERTAELIKANKQLQQEITERKQAEEALRESELWMRSMFNSLEEGVFVVTPDRTLVSMNSSAQKMFGYSKGELADLSTEILHVDHEHYLEFGRSIKEAFDKGETANFKFEVKKKNGDIFPSEHTVSLLKNDAGEPIGIVSVLRDITERKRAEEELRKYRDHLEELVEQRTVELKKANEQLEQEITERKRAEEELKRKSEEQTLLLDNIETQIWYLTDAETYGAVNMARAKFLELEKIDLVGKKIYDVHDKEEVELCIAGNKEVFENKTQIQTEEWIKNGKGEAQLLSITKTPKLDDNGNVEYIVCSGQDITKRKRAEEAMERQRQAVERLAEEIEIVAKIGRIIDSTLEIDKVYELFAEEVRKIIPFNRIGINIINHERGTYVTTYIAGRDVPGHRPGDVAPLAGSLTEEVVRTRSSLLIQTEDRDEVGERFPGPLPDFQAGFRSFMAVPLISKDQVIGALHLQSVKAKAYTTVDVNLAESIGSQIAGAIANAQLYQELKRQWAFSTTLIDTMSEGLGVLDETGRLEFANRKLLHLLGYSSQEGMGKHWSSLVHPDDHGLMRAQGSSGKDARPSSYECRLLRKGGTSVPVLISWAPRFDDRGQQKGSVGIVTDLTERKRAEQRLREYEARYSHLLDHMPDGVALTRRGRIIRVNPPMARMFGYPSPEKIEGLYVWDLAAPVSKEIMRQQSTLRALGQQVENRFEFEALRKDGQAFPAEITLTVDRSEPQPFVLSIIRNVTERKNYENQRKLLSDRIMTAQEKERTLIARELHDELGQALTGIKMDMAWIKNHIEAPDEAISDRFVALGDLIDSTIESVQKMATTLRPSVLDRLGLVAAVEWHANQFERRTGIECIIESEASDFTINSKTAINAYRIFQEALTNVARHAQASRVDVRMAEDRGTLAICISDDGRGIPSKNLSGPMSLGIAGMRERAELVKGSLDIQSQRGKGTRVTAYLPLSSKGGASYD
ncbi:MAG: PAS domain S-box protein [Desulfobacterales bacterium]|nr:PAS domain S-box protein [Desulfobacterales bacterium]